MTEYRLPENAEASIVGCVLLEPEVKAEVSKLISESDFESPAYAAMYAAALEMGEPDGTIFHELVRKRGYTLPDVAVSKYNIELYAKLLRERAQRRQLMELGQHIQERALEQEDPAELIIQFTRILV